MEPFEYIVGPWCARSNSDGKEIFVSGPDDFMGLIIDSDDVDHETVEDQTKKLVDLLSTHWS